MRAIRTLGLGLVAGSSLVADDRHHLIAELRSPACYVPLG